MENDTEKECGCVTMELASSWWVIRCEQHRYWWEPADLIVAMDTEDENE